MIWLLAKSDAPPPDGGLNLGLLFGGMLLCALAGGHVAHLVRLPRVVGYLLTGTALRVVLPMVLDVEAGGAQAQALASVGQRLQVVRDLALGLILFSIGGVFEFRHLRTAGRSMWRFGLAEAGTTVGLVFAGVLAVTAVVSPPGASWATLIAFALLLGLAAICTAPAATLFTLREYEAKGPVTDTLLNETGLNIILCIVGFQVCFLLMAGGGVLVSGSGVGDSTWVGAVINTAGSLVLGTVMGFAVAVAHNKLSVGNTVVVLVAVLIGLRGGEAWLMTHGGVSYNYLLTTIALGAVFANIAVDPDRIETAIRSAGAPLFVGFFVLAGYQLHLEDLRHWHSVGLAYVVGRVGGKVLGMWLGLRWAGRTADLHPLTGVGLLCQAPVAIALADYVNTHWHEPEAAQSFVTTLFGSVVIFEVCGPVMLKWLVVRCGEVKAVTLLRRVGSSPESRKESSTTRRTALALWRALGGGRSNKPSKEQASLRVGHLMRSNVKCIPAAARFDEVLHFVEQSRHNQFPVTDADDRLVGVIHFSDLRQIIYDPALGNLVTAADLCDLDALAVPEDMPLEELLVVFRDNDLGSLPVIANTPSKKVVGIIEQRDLLKTLR